MCNLVFHQLSLYICWRTTRWRQMILVCELQNWTDSELSTELMGAGKDCQWIIALAWVEKEFFYIFCIVHYAEIVHQNTV